uniref:Gelsolin-like domain-containing protein n=1 Tax=Anabas testudineus TaxID=64144 RepID=A0AAQ6IEA9_ANATE
TGRTLTMACHKEFETAGKKPGLQVWRIEKMDLKPVPAQLHGNFFIGDAYIVLYTTPAPSYNVHSWIGDEASQDERGAAAIFMTQLDDFMHGAPRQFTEFQNQESVTFLGYFKSGIKYKKGGVASGFHHVETNEANVKRLLHVKGRRLIKATEVDLSWASFNKGDCFIIDLGKDIYHWSGSESNRFERVKTTELAIDIRDNERKGRAEIHMIEEGREPEAVTNVLGPLPNLSPGSADDEAVDIKNKNQASLYLVSDAAGSMKTSVVAEKNPFKQSMLSQNDCYILDNGADNKIFVWKGRQNASAEERRAALTVANKFIQEKNYPKNTQVQVMPAGAETTLFKQFFFNWLDKDETTGPTQPHTIGRIAKVKQIPFDPSTLHSNTVMAAQHGMVDDGSGKVQIWRVEKGEKVPVDPSTYGQFFGGDCYLVLYSYKVGGKEKHIIYTWQGQKCSQDELGASAFLTVKLDDSMGGAATQVTQVRVTQGQEPPHLVSLFKGKPLIVHLGGTSRKGGESKPGKTRLFHIRQSSTKAMRAVEVSGAQCPSGFWTALGGKKDYQTSKTLQKVVKPPRLFACSNKTGRLIVSILKGRMLPSLLMKLLISFSWDANETEKTGAPKIAQDYVKSDPSGRSGIPISTIKQGQEPPSFTGWFQAWDGLMWDKDPLQAIQERIKKA